MRIDISSGLTDQKWFAMDFDDLPDPWSKSGFESEYRHLPNGDPDTPKVPYFREARVKRCLANCLTNCLSTCLAKYLR